MYTDKRILLIGGGGTLGTYVSCELLRMGAVVEIICPEEKQSDNERLIFHRSYATEPFLRVLFEKKHYDGIVNFIHYYEVDEYRPIHSLLMQNTEHLIFLSSYRVYADECHPITEDAPRLFDIIIKDKTFLENEKYAVSKAKCEDFLRNEHRNEAWTIVRPVISFSSRRLDLLMYSGNYLLQAAETGKELLLPDIVRNYSAGLDWAGNTGKLIANLLFKSDAIGEAFTIYSGHGLTWGDVAQIYTDMIGVKVRWCDEKEYLEHHTAISSDLGLKWAYWYDRRYDRDIDCSKVLRVTGLDKSSFTSIEQGIRHELIKLGYNL